MTSAYRCATRHGVCRAVSSLLTDCAHDAAALYLFSSLSLLLAAAQDISDRTMMMPTDIIETLKQLGLLQYWKGSHYIAANPKVVDEYWRLYSGSGGRWLEVDLKCLHWQPLTTGQLRGK